MILYNLNLYIMTICVCGERYRSLSIYGDERATLWCRLHYTLGWVVGTQSRALAWETHAFTACAVLLVLDPRFLVITFQWNDFHILEQDIPGTVKYLYLKGAEEELSYLKKCSSKKWWQWPVVEEKGIWSVAQGAYEGTHGSWSKQTTTLCNENLVCLMDFCPN